jgi:hypothetical protein
MHHLPMASRKKRVPLILTAPALPIIFRVPQITPLMSNWLGGYVQSAGNIFSFMKRHQKEGTPSPKTGYPKSQKQGTPNPPSIQKEGTPKQLAKPENSNPSQWGGGDAPRRVRWFIIYINCPPKNWQTHRLPYAA